MQRNERTILRDTKTVIKAYQRSGFSDVRTILKSDGTVEVVGSNNTSQPPSAETNWDEVLSK